MTEDSEKKCPKCGYFAIHGDECPKCGLILSKHQIINNNQNASANQGKKAVIDPAWPELLQKADIMAFYQILIGLLIVLIGVLFISYQLYKAHETSSIDNELESMIRIDNESKIDFDMIDFLVSSLKMHLAKGPLETSEKIKSSKKKNLFGMAGIFIGTWLIFYGIGKRRAIKIYPKSALLAGKQTTVIIDIYDRDTAFIMIKWGICLFLLSAFNMIKAIWSAMDYIHWHALYGSSFESFGLIFFLLSGLIFSIFLLLAGGVCIFRAYRTIQPELHFQSTYVKNQSGIINQNTYIKNQPGGINQSTYVKKQPGRINLGALVQAKYLIRIIIITMILGVGYHYYSTLEAQKAYLRFNEPMFNGLQSKYAKERMEIILDHKFSRVEESAGCNLSGLDSFIDTMQSSDHISYEDIVTCANRFDQSPEIIEPFFDWYLGQNQEDRPYSISSMSEIITAMREKAIGPVRNIFQTTGNEKVVQSCARILRDICSQEALDVLVKAIKDDSGLRADSAAKEIEAIVVSGYYKLPSAFELVKNIYEFDNPKLRSLAIKTLLLFEGSGPVNLAIKGTHDPDEKVQEIAKEILSKLTP